jgi:hypothetical protein
MSPQRPQIYHVLNASISYKVLIGWKIVDVIDIVKRSFMFMSTSLPTAIESKRYGGISRDVFEWQE